mgnify:CR=1 FL=1
MAVRYQIDGDIFREITPHWLCASINEFLIKVRKTDVDQTGATVEHLQLNDGRIFTRLIPCPQSVDIPRDSNSRRRNVRLAIEHSLTQPR